MRGRLASKPAASSIAIGTGSHSIRSVVQTMSVSLLNECPLPCAAITEKGTYRGKPQPKNANRIADESAVSVDFARLQRPHALFRTGECLCASCC